MLDAADIYIIPITGIIHIHSSYLSKEVCIVNIYIPFMYLSLFVVCDMVKRLFDVISVILQLYLHETSKSAVTLERSCRRDSVGVPPLSRIMR